MSLPPELLDILVCPKCKGPLEHHEGPPEVLICRSERLVFAVEEGIPIMLIEEATPLDENTFPPVIR
jgi:uncharacterized protein YbaR (Trm112 family)